MMSNNLKKIHGKFQTNSSSEMCGIPSMEKEHMYNSGSEAGKTDTIGYRKEGANIKRSFTVIRLNVNVKVGIYYS
jgi:hypothetical protein